MKTFSRRFVVLCLCAMFGGAFGQALAATVVRGPYLQKGTPDSVVIRWRTDEAVQSRVNYGLTQATLGSNVQSADMGFDHELTLSGLTPATRYYYSVGTFTEVLAGGDADHFFQTAPPPGTPQPTRVWVLGDSGSADSNAMAVRDAYQALALAENRYTDLWLMLGDNAYTAGTDQEYQDALFDMYPETLRQSVLWPTIGNHDLSLADPAAAPYFQMFTLPTGTETGGFASGTEAYYSFDYANVHFVVLDSYSSDRTPGGPMLTWLQADLAANDQDWIVAFWHHPPYSKGSHDSDDSVIDFELGQMRSFVLPILEAHGVDLVLSGHSHSYERSYLIDGHYGLSGSFSPAQHVIDGGDGRVTGDGAYRKPAYLGVPNRGTVYTVAGSSGKVTGGSLDHPAMFVSLNMLGSVVLDIDGNTLDAIFLDDTGNEQDSFTLVKDPALITDFAATPRSGVVPLTVDFTDRSVNEPTAWAWDLDGDGFVDSTQQHPTFTYEEPGIYSVTLTVNSAGGVDEEFKQDYIQVDLAPPIADFTAADRTGLVPLTVQFTDRSLQSPSQWEWDFDNDGTVDSTLQNPIHVYTEVGLYSVKLTVSNPAGSDTLVETSFIAVLPQVPDAVTGLLFEPGGSSIVWDALPVACNYDLARGDLFALRASGDYRTTSVSCLEEDLAVPQASAASTPGTGEAFYYLVRGVDCGQAALTYNTAGIGQVASRDFELQDATFACDCQPIDDPDSDGFCVNVDNCPGTSNSAQGDLDSDGVGDVCDNCPSMTNAGQLDFDLDGQGNICDPDDDDDGTPDDEDACPFDQDNDIEGDGFCANVDNCPLLFNDDQADADVDGSGDVCDCLALNPNCNTDCTDVDGDSYCVTSDCDDDAADVFPGAAPNDSADACMKDTDDDDWGDETPPVGVVPGTDCDDELFTTNPDTLWYADLDGDGFGDPDSGQPSCEQPLGLVSDASDCDDASANAADTFPGAAPNDNADDCMRDVDGDDWGDQNVPQGVVAGTDCNDFDSQINPDTLWYADTDGDTFGDPGVSVASCGSPLDFVNNALDCDDVSGSGAETFPGAAPNDDVDSCMKDVDLDNWGDATPPPGVDPGTDCDDDLDSINPETVWYRDLDGDGFGDPAFTQIACEQPADHVLDNTDCRDGDSAVFTDIFPGSAPNDSETACMQDVDGDDWGDDDPMPGVTPGTDCDDGDAAINPQTIWYRDLDGDGFGDPAFIQVACEQPADHVLDNTDCRDGNGAVFSDIFPGSAPNDSETACMQDSDGDDWGDDDPLPGVTPGTDCDDADALINPETIWYADSDGDDFGDAGTTLMACEQPAGFVADDTDCDDALGSAFPGAAPNDSLEACMKDADEDDWGDAVPPRGGTAGTDCSDADTNNWVSCASCADMDGDTYFTDCDRYLTIDGPDCNDADPLINPATVWYADTDGDGFGDAGNAQVSCTQPMGFIADATDCDDTSAATFPGAAPKDSATLCMKDTDGDGWGDLTPSGSVAPGTDCDDDDAAISPETLWFADTDLDGFGDAGVTQASCTLPAGFLADDTDCDDTSAATFPGAAPGDSETACMRDVDDDGYGDDDPPPGVTAGTDCDDANAALNPQTLWYADTDEDGFGDAQSTLVVCEQPAGYLADDTDCDDTDTNNWASCADCVDADADTFFVGCDRYLTINGPDCDDTAATTFPGAAPNNNIAACMKDADGDDWGDDDPPPGVAEGTDCDDTDAVINPQTVWYHDGDHDGFGDPLDPQVTCNQPGNHVLDSTDCDDGDTNNWVSCATCLDADGDGRFIDCDRYESINGPDCDDTDTNNWDSCATCLNADNDAEFVGCDRYLTIDGPDCDDTDTNNWDSCATCVDGDADTYFKNCDRYETINGPDCNDDDTNNWDSCGSCDDSDSDDDFYDCDRYETINGPDCDDDDDNNWDSCATCVDADADTYFTGCDRYKSIDGPDCDDDDTNNWDSCATCADEDADTNFVVCDRYLTIDGPDCDDTDTNNWDSCATCEDQDADTYFVACDRYLTINGPDCDDTDTNNWASCGSCLDVDNDTYFADCDRYETINGPDCDDADTNNWDSCASCLDVDTDTYFVDCDRYLTINGPDCDDAQAATFPGAAPNDNVSACMKDVDGDDWGDLNPPPGVTPGTDCDDDDASLNPQTPWYADTDGDGFGDALASVTACEQPADHVADDTDCDDTDANNWASCATCVDADADTYFVGCDRYLTINGPDCDDADTNNWASCASCVDVDADTYFVGCDRYLTINGPDCDDADTNNWDSCATCTDADADTYFVTCDRYLTINGPDCDDAAATTFPGAAPNNNASACMKDADDDDWGDATPPPSVTPGTDCDDDDASLNPQTVWYADTDGDGFGDPLASVMVCVQPADHVSDGTDCDDTDTNNWASCASCVDTDADTYFVDCDRFLTISGPDCDDTAATTFPGAAPNNNASACMKDVDGDDWGDATPPPSVTPGTDCDDDDALINPQTVWYADTDEDGFGDALVTVMACEQPAGHVADATDCSDADTNNWNSCGTCVDADTDTYFVGCDRYLTINGPDCDDTDTNNWNSCGTCVDADTDTYFVDCDRYLTINGPDCDDTDTNNWDSCATCADADTDTYFAACDRYLTIIGPDCDDTDTNNWNSCATCVDADTDTYFVDCDRYLTINGTDCDDTDTNNWNSCGTCVDADTDTYFVDCDRYLTINGTDCDDTDTNNWNSCATCVDADTDTYFVDCDRYLTINGTDCDDTDTNNWNSCATCVDADTDTYFVDCDRYLTINGTDCDDTDTNNWNSCGTCVDADTDTYFVACNRYLTINGPDCDDDSDTTFPGAAFNDSTSACMKDDDGDGWGDLTPPPGVTPGQDCDDDDIEINPTNGC